MNVKKCFRTQQATFKISLCFVLAISLLLAPVANSWVLAQENPQDPVIIKEEGSGDGDAEEQLSDPDENFIENEDPIEDMDTGDEGDTDEATNSEGNEGNNEEILGEADQSGDFIEPVEPSAYPPEDLDVIPNPPLPCGENMILNGDFEYPDVDSSYQWDIFPLNSNLTDWFGNWMPTVPTVYGDYQRPNPALLELQAGVNDWIAQSGNQYAELDTDWDGPSGSMSGEPASVYIYQDLTTTPGNLYKVSFYFSPRPDTSVDDNILQFEWDGDIVDTISRPGETDVDWSYHTYTFEAVSDITRVQFSDLGNPNSLGTFLDNVWVEEVCPEPCQPGPQWADNVESYNQGPIKGGGSVETGRSNPESALGEPDGVFYSLGQGGNLVVSFNQYILDVEGNDLSFHEITYGRYSYPEETILVEVSQNGSDWYEIGTATNQAPDNGIDYLDFSSTGLPWIKYVRITDTTDFNLHIDGADGYDIDAIDATYGACNYLELEKFGEFNPETGEIIYTINWSVIGEGIAYDMVITDELPDGTSFVSADNGGTESSGTVTWNLGDIVAPDSGTVSFIVTLDAFVSMDVWADWVESFNQGLRKDRQPVLEERSDPENALGEAENNDTLNFVSLGFGDDQGGGELVLGFNNYIINGDGDDIEVFETSYGNPSEEQYPETAEIYASQYGINWAYLGTIILDGTVDLSDLTWARYIKIIDVSNPDDFFNTETTDGFDVDGVRAIYSLPDVCSIDNTALGRVNTEPNNEGEIIWAEASTTTIINELACEDPYQEDNGCASGMKFNDRNDNGEQDEGEEGLEGWTIYAGKLVETLEVDSNGPETGTPIDSMPLIDFQKYFLRVSSTFHAGDLITADAKYSVREPNTEWTDIVQNYESWGPTLLDLHIDEIAPDWGSYNPSHVYWHTLFGDGNPVTFQIYDIYASNNVGTLTVKIYEVVAEDITDIDGNYWLNLAGIEGNVIIAEQTQSGWVQTAPLPDGFYPVSANDESTGLNFGNREIMEDEEEEPELGLITGMKFNDVNGNAEKDEGEDGLAEWIIYLDLNVNGEKDQDEPYQSTDNYGNYSFIDLEYGDYVVREEIQSGWSQTFPGYDYNYAYNLTIDSGTNEWHGIDFGNQEGGVDQQGSGGSGGGYYTPPADEEEVAGEQDEDTNDELALGDNNTGTGGGDILGEQNENGLAQTGTNAWLLLLLLLGLSIMATFITYRTHNWQDR